MDNIWECCDCSEEDTNNHEILWSFSQYGNDQLKKEDFLVGNNRCEKHFNAKQKEFNLLNIHSTDSQNKELPTLSETTKDV